MNIPSFQATFYTGNGLKNKERKKLIDINWSNILIGSKGFFKEESTHCLAIDYGFSGQRPVAPVSGSDIRRQLNENS